MSEKVYGRERLVELRKSRGLTQKKLADLLQTNQATISRIENNRCEISPFLLCDIAKFYNVSIKYINGEEEEKSIDQKSKIIVNGINEYDEIIIRYKTLSDEHKQSIKLLLDLYYQMEHEAE